MMAALARILAWAWLSALGLVAVAVVGSLLYRATFDPGARGLIGVLFAVYASLASAAFLMADHERRKGSKRDQ